jgi:thiol-disulfide isomerase/thioredoxin
MIRTSVAPFVLASLLTFPLGAAPSTDAPDITLTALSGKTLRIADLRGKVVLLDFWASWCVPCRKSFPAVDALHRELEPKGLVVIAVNVDEQQKNAFTFLERYPHTMAIAFDPRGEVAQAFNLQAMPSTLIVDRSGHIRFTHMGYTEKTIDQFRAEALRLLAEGE